MKQAKVRGRGRAELGKVIMHVMGQGIVECNFQLGSPKQELVGVMTPLYPREV